ncbi:MAG: hypothetical protein WC960_00015 [Bacteroidales bacterium]
MKKNVFKVLAVAIALFSISACCSPLLMVQNAKLIDAKGNPQILEVVADKIEANYTMDFPTYYFHPDAIMEVVPVLVYKGGEAAAPALKLQGEKVLDNFQVVPNSGGQANGTALFDYKPGMENSRLELRAYLLNKGKKIALPAPYPIADGAITTYKLVNTKGERSPLQADNYSEVVREHKETQFLFNINSDKVLTKELTKSEIKEFQQFLTNLANDNQRVVKGTEIIAYASPEGPIKLNTKLSQGRGDNAKKALEKITNKEPLVGPITVTSIGEDWDGFQKLVAASDIKDKDLILRVLSMYSDPVVREREIKNISMVYKILADKILPELRRARMVTSIDFNNYTPEQLVELVGQNIDQLDVEALLRAATLIKDWDTKATIYKKVGDKFNDDRGYLNLASIALAKEKLDVAKNALAKVSNKTTPVYYNSAGIAALQSGDYSTAATLFAKSNSKESKVNSATLDILNGKYSEAASKLAGTKSENEGLAYILTNQLDKASQAITCKCADAAYLRAIIAARKGDKAEVAKQLEIASSNSALKARAESDIEFAKYR